MTQSSAEKAVLAQERRALVYYTRRETEADIWLVTLR